MAYNRSNIFYYDDRFILAYLLICCNRFGLHLDCRLRCLIVLPKILYSKFPAYTWNHNEIFSNKDFILWQQDYEKWNKAKSVKAKKKIAQKWAIKPKKSNYVRKIK